MEEMPCSILFDFLSYLIMNFKHQCLGFHKVNMLISATFQSKRLIIHAIDTILLMWLSISMI